MNKNRLFAKQRIKDLLAQITLSKGPPEIKKYSYYFGKAMSQQIEFPMTRRENTALVMIWVYKEKNQDFSDNVFQGDSIQ